MRRTALLAPAALVLVAAGCGGGSGQNLVARPGTSTTAPTLARHPASPRPALPAPPSRAVRGNAFVTAVPKTWSLRTKRHLRTVAYFAGSPGARVDDYGLPHPAGAGITILVAPARSRALSGNPIALVRRAVGLPPHARSVRLAAPAHATRLGNSPAGSLAFAYRIGKRSVLQDDVVARRNGTLALVELDVVDLPAAKARQAAAAFRLVVDRWRWQVSAGPTT